MSSHDRRPVPVDQCLGRVLSVMTFTTPGAGAPGHGRHQARSPPGLPSAIFGNPATRTRYGGTRSIFGSSFYEPQVAIQHDGSANRGCLREPLGAQSRPLPGARGA